MSNLIVRGISAGYGKVNVVRDVSLTVPEGRRIALVGSNGAGKSTIVRTITAFWHCVVDRFNGTGCRSRV